MSTDAAELRRQKILKNSQKRLELLMGVKNAEASILNNNEEEPSNLQINKNNSNNINESLNQTQSADNIKLSNDDKTIFKTHSQVEPVVSTSPLINEQSLIDDRNDFVDDHDNFNSNLEINQPNIESSKQSESVCKFNGYSNKEILIMFSIALITSVLFFLNQADYIYKNVLLPFFTFELAHLIIHFKHLPSTSSQFQLFRTLLQLCGISQKSLKKLMIVFNFLFILLDNFVIYILSFVLINIIIKSLFFV